MPPAPAPRIRTASGAEFNDEIWFSALNERMSQWESSGMPSEDSGRKRLVKSIESLLLEAAGAGRRVTRFRGPYGMIWYNNLFRLYMKTGIAPAFFTDDDESPLGPATPTQLYSTLLQVRTGCKRLFMDALRDRPTFQTCIYFLLSWMTSFHSYLEGEEAREFDLFAVHWITLPRTYEELTAVHQAQCSCGEIDPDLGRPPWHAAGKEFFRTLSTHGETAIGGDRLIRDLLQPITVLSDSSRNLSGRKARYLDAVELVLPHGPEHTSRGMIEWLTLSPAPHTLVHILGALQCIFMRSSSMVLPYYLDSDTLVTQGICAAFNLAHQLLDPEPKVIADVYSCIKHAMMLLIAMVRVLCNPRESFDFHQRFGSQLWRSYKHFFCTLQTIKSTRHSYPTMKHLLAEDATSPVEAYRDPATEIHLLGGALFHDRMVGDQIPDEFVGHANRHEATLISECRKAAVTLNPNREEAIWSAFVAHIAFVDNSMKCCYSQCTKPYKVADLNIKQCHGCKHIQYCSRLCQKRAWIDSAYPHREICRLMRQACARFNISSHVTAGKVPLPSRSRLTGYWPTIKVLLQYYNGISQAQSRTLDDGIKSEAEWRRCVITDRSIIIGHRWFGGVSEEGVAMAHIDPTAPYLI